MPYKKLRIEIKNRVGHVLLDAGLRFNKLSVTTIRAGNLHDLGNFQRRRGAAYGAG